MMKHRSFSLEGKSKFIGEANYLFIPLETTTYPAKMSALLLAVQQIKWGSHYAARQAGRKAEDHIDLHWTKIDILISYSSTRLPLFIGLERFTFTSPRGLVV